MDDNFVSRLKFAMAINNKKPKELANKTGISVVSVYGYLGGSHKPTPNIIKKLAEALSVSDIWLVYGDGNADIPRRPKRPKKLKKPKSESTVTAKDVERNRAELIDRASYHMEMPNGDLSHNSPFEEHNTYPFMEVIGCGYGSLYGHRTLEAIEEGMIEKGRSKPEINKALLKAKEWF